VRDAKVGMPAASSAAHTSATAWAASSSGQTTTPRLMERTLPGNGREPLDQVLRRAGFDVAGCLREMEPAGAVTVTVDDVHDLARKPG
jgi:hypothetical protein